MTRAKSAPFPWRWATGIVLAVLLLGTAGCSQDANSVAAQAEAGDRKGYVSGDGAVETIPIAKRGVPVELQGTFLDGSAWDITSTRAKVLVINVWGSWCAPCVAEAPVLQKTWDDLQAEKVPVRFVGIDFREDPARGAAFATKVGVTYPSLTDESGVAILALQGKAPTVPTTLVLDTQGRIAARVNGASSGSTLRGLVEDVLAGS